MSEATAGRLLRTDENWVHRVDPRMPGVAHGWKLHVSARPATLEQVVARVLPVLDEYVCHVKYARTPELLRALNSGFRSPGAVGKAVTVYPAPGTVVEIASALVEVLNGIDGPRVLSDMRVSPSAPVYYRYGPFEATYRTGSGGRIESVMIGPDGQGFDGLATGHYRCPPWAVDPFQPDGSSAQPARTSALLGGGRYEITAGIVRAAHGNVYRAIDHELTTRVVLKQARPFVAEDDSELDARHRLRHERLVLERLEGIDGIPRFVDYFEHAGDEFLVMADCGARDLRRDVLENGPYRLGDDDRDPLVLADRLTALLDEVHRRGVTVRDVKPNNMVLDALGHPHLVDFGISALDGSGPGGATLGYTPPGPEHPRDPDADRYALGVTLGFAATGLEPVLIDADPAVNRDRTLAGLEAADVPTPVAQRIRTLMQVSGASRLPPIPDEDLLDEIIADAVAYCVQAARDIVREGSGPTDLYAGSSGLGWELLQHRERPGAADALELLARWTARQARDMSASLYSGRIGVAVFLQQAGLPYDHDGLLPRGRLDGGPPEADLIEGAAGVGLGHLYLLSAEASDAPLHSGVREFHLAGAAECHRLLTSGIATLTPTDAAKPGNAALAAGIAHGDAGVAYFLAEYGRMVGGVKDFGGVGAVRGVKDFGGVGDSGGIGVVRGVKDFGGIGDFGGLGQAEAVAAARAACDRLAALTPALLVRAQAPEATRRYGSWCRGLAGIGSVLVRAAECVGEPGYLELAGQCADACVRIAPRMPQVVQCCGLAGVGDFVIDLAEATGDGRRWDEAARIAQLVLVRSGGTWARPVFPDVELTRASAGWAGGTSGVLGFLRRLRRRGGSRLATAPRQLR